MSTSAQQRVRELFDKGDINLLVATAVLGEGADFPGCKLVAQMDSVYSGRSRMQADGRAARRSGGKSVTFYYKGTGEERGLCRSRQQVEAFDAALVAPRAPAQLNISLPKVGSVNTGPCSKLSEYCQKQQRAKPLYNIHSKKAIDGFTCTLTFDGEAVECTRPSKQKAKTAAAAAMCDKLGVLYELK